MSDDALRDAVKEKYGQAARRVARGGTPSCDAESPPAACDPITSNLYERAETAELPREAVAASLGCGNPTALAELRGGRDRGEIERIPLPADAVDVVISNGVINLSADKDAGWPKPSAC